MSGRLIVPKEEAQAKEQDATQKFAAELAQAHAQALSDSLRPVLIEILVRLDMLARIDSGQRPKAEIKKQLDEKDREARKAAAQAELARIEAEADAAMDEAAAEEEAEDDLQRVTAAEVAQAAATLAAVREAEGDV